MGPTAQEFSKKVTNTDFIENALITAISDAKMLGIDVEHIIADCTQHVEVRGYRGKMSVRIVYDCDLPNDDS